MQTESSITKTQRLALRKLAHDKVMNGDIKTEAEIEEALLLWPENWVAQKLAMCKGDKLATLRSMGSPKKAERISEDDRQTAFRIVADPTSRIAMRRVFTDMHVMREKVIARMGVIALYSTDRQNALKAADFLAKVGGWYAASKNLNLNANATDPNIASLIENLVEPGEPERVTEIG